MNARAWSWRMLTLLSLVLFLLLILWIFVFPAKRAAGSATDAEVASGVQWLQEQEAHSPDDVEAQGHPSGGAGCDAGRMARKALQRRNFRLVAV